MFYETLEAPQPWAGGGGGGAWPPALALQSLLWHRQNPMVPWGQWGLFALAIVPMVGATRPPKGPLLATRRSRGPQPGSWVSTGLWGLGDPCPEWPGEPTRDLADSRTLALITGLCKPHWRGEEMGVKCPHYPNPDR